MKFTAHIVGRKRTADPSISWKAAISSKFSVSVLFRRCCLLECRLSNEVFKSFPVISEMQLTESCCSWVVNPNYQIPNSVLWLWIWDTFSLGGKNDSFTLRVLYWFVWESQKLRTVNPVNKVDTVWPHFDSFLHGVMLGLIPYRARTKLGWVGRG